MESSTAPAIATQASDPTQNRPFQRLAWPAIPQLPRLTGSTIPDVGRSFFAYSSTSILKMGAGHGEAIMTALANEVLGSVAPCVEAVVSITRPPEGQGILLTRRPGTPLVELWPALDTEKRKRVKASLTALLVRLHDTPGRFDYYGRPEGQPYITLSELGPNAEHAFCKTRAEWDSSRVLALRGAASEAEIDDDRVRTLERVQHEAGKENANLIDTPVLTHCDLSDRNILVEPETLEVTGLIDWEFANITPAYFEYAAARLCGGHEPEWRKEILEVLRDVLRVECDRAVAQADGPLDAGTEKEKSKQLFEETLAAWRALVDVERAAQGYSDDCYWTFEDEPSASTEP